jgi:dTDP-4-dehydrorhamnose reductase
MRVLVIGATGQLGQDLLREFGEATIGLSHRDLEVTNGVDVLGTIQALQPDWVINTAAFHNVEDCESNPALAFAVNAVGAGTVARAAYAVGAGIVFFSTDYVFGGDERDRECPYSESDPPSPLNVYGISKAAGEQMVIQANPKHLVIRSAGLFGTATSRKGWTFPELMITKARSGEHLRVVDDQVLSPTYTTDLASKVKELIDRECTGLFHVTNSGECSWYELACATLQVAGLDASIEPILTTPSQHRATRPEYSALAGTRLCEEGLIPLRPWRDALEAYLQAKELIQAKTPGTL